MKKAWRCVSRLVKRNAIGRVSPCGAESSVQSLTRRFQESHFANNERISRFFVVPVTCSREGEGRDGGEREGEGSFSAVFCLCGVIL